MTPLPPRDQPFDLVVVGGGINGAGIARDAAGRGLSVLLCERGDLASGTSSASSKLIHGGLRYLESYHFRLVQEALTERDVLLRIAPHVVWPLRFVLPHTPGMRPAWMLRLGLWLYDGLTRRVRLPGSRRVDLRRHEAGAALRPTFETGFTYSDCWADDSRLVVLNAVDAANRGATILPRTEVLGAERVGDLWRITLAQASAGSPSPVMARAMVYAAGPWMKGIIESTPGLSSHALRLVKGSHLVFRRLFEGTHAYILQNDDGRIVFALPFLDRFTLVGTTDVDFEGDPARVSMDDREAAYLCDSVNRYFNEQVSPQDAVWSFSGLRPLIDDASRSPSQVTREYVLDLDAPPHAAPAVSVIGGKLTAYRNLAEKTLALLKPCFPGLPGSWSAGAALPGGDLPNGGPQACVAELLQARPWLDAAHAQRLMRAYGTLCGELLGDASSPADLGKCFGADLYEREVVYMMEREWARCADDVLWRRSKLGLSLSAAQADALQQWMAARLGDSATASR